MSKTTTITSDITGSASLARTQSINVPLLAEFNYYSPTADGLGEPSTNDLELILGTKDQDTRKLPVYDVRGRENDFSLEMNGFCYTKLRSGLKEEEGCFLNDDMIEGKYYCEIEDLLRAKFPTLTHIHHLGHIIRSAPKRTDFSLEATTPTDPAWNKPNRGAAPAPRVHIDFTRLGVHLVLIQAFGPQLANSVTECGRRFIAFSIWRPIKTIKRDPLGICDAQSVRAEELVPIKRVYPDGKTGENVVVKAVGRHSKENECKHVWYWMSDQTPEDVLMIKIFDSQDEDWERGGRVRVGPHASFHLPGTEEEDVRESIEIRVVVSF